MKHLFRPLRRLQWKLTLSYALTTVLALLLVEILIIAVIFLVVNVNLPQFIQFGLQQQALQVSPYFIHAAPDREALEVWINLPNATAGGTYQYGYFAIVDKQGQIIASIGNSALPSGTVLQAHLSHQEALDLHRVLIGPASAQGFVDREANGGLLAMVPIPGKHNAVQGALIQFNNNLAQSNAFWVSVYSTYVVLPSSLLIIIFASIAGTIFGLLTARGLTRRFKRLSVVADNWSLGDFSVFTHDPSGDELGQLSQKLNRMAEQLQNLLQTRQKLAVLEERNRIARDLHDSVKQHIFAVALQIGTAKLYLRQNVDVLEQHLTEAERVLLQVQQEMKTIIRELRPVALTGKGLCAALQELVTQWTQQTTITANQQLAENVTLPLLTEEALFRVAQETLANVAQHSHATTVQVQLTNQRDHITLSICDDGQGFEVADATGKGIGLLSMQERMQALNGELVVESTLGKGTRVIARCTNTTFTKTE